MYESYYGLRGNPFSLIPDPAYLYQGRKHKLALNLLEYGMLNRSAFTVITGEPGTGKTTLLNTILERSERAVTLGVLSHTHVGLGSLLPWVLMTFGVDGKGMDSVELYRAFAGFLNQEHDKHRRVVLVVDEAQNLGGAMLEELRLLSNLNDARRQPLQIILSGQPALRALLRQSELVQFAQRISVDYHLEPFDHVETPEYIRHRINVAGGPATLMTDAAYLAVHRLSGGNARLINQVCDVALAYGFAAQSRWITSQMVIKAAMDRSAGGILPLMDVNPTELFTEEEQRLELQQICALSQPAPAVKPNTKSSNDSETATGLYKRGVAFKNAGAYKQAISFFEQAAQDQGLAMKSNTQIALCLRACGRAAEATRMFQQLLKSGHGTEEDRRQVRYFLARILEASGQIDAAIGLYRALGKEHRDYRDVKDRLGRLAAPESSGSWSASGWWAKLLPRRRTPAFRNPS
ncbi:hypothetical protein W02_42780 [Nitrospira sp. KM1]|uniref:AAA family ATPase n=1 Tax=Nitrospira sp. KM1 TaxID=1936990 RepID=UPI0013A742AD|nr:AAA family ATPase [Nitrospira sp. KM1]BCA57138.1 hypothetical protein W02_42780 [Nitrospira sp. KM1]